MCRLKNVNNTQIYMHMNLNFVIDSFALIFAALTLDFYLSFGLVIQLSTNFKLWKTTFIIISNTTYKNIYICMMILNSQQKEVLKLIHVYIDTNRWMSTSIFLLPYFIDYKQYQKVPHYHTEPLSVWTSALGVSLSACCICFIPDTLHTWDVFH